MRKLSGFIELLIGILSGAIQGISEWLPVSSKTLLLLIFYQLGFSPSSAYLIGLFLNGATASAAAIYFRSDLLKALKGFAAGGECRQLLLFLLFSTLVTALVAVPLAFLIAGSLSTLGGFSMIMIGILFGFTSLMSWIRSDVKRSRIKLRNTPTLKDAILTGLAQGFSALPGISRSGVTIFALILLRHHPSSAVRLSFLMAIPATLGGGVYAYLFSPSAVGELAPITLVTSMCVSIAVSIVTISSLLKASQKIKPHIFTAILAVIAVAMGLIAL